ncbi:MAG: hypothetical protein KDB00_17030 [Planctomycetales bacterium]|nr:hypothetical protein [Planctomycetales bacterium]
MSGTPSQQPTSGSTPLAAGGAQAAPKMKFQISLTLMLLLMVVFAFISAALFYASRVPAIREEIGILIYGKSSGGGEDAGRIAHRIFIMFTFASPLILACVLSLSLSILKFFQRTK